MSKIAKDGKTENITIRATSELKNRAENVWRKKYQVLPFNTFLAQMIQVGLEEEEMWIEIKEKRKTKIEADVLLRSAHGGTSPERDEDSVFARDIDDEAKEKRA